MILLPFRAVDCSPSSECSCEFTEKKYTAISRSPHRLVFHVNTYTVILLPFRAVDCSPSTSECSCEFKTQKKYTAISTSPHRLVFHINTYTVILLPFGAVDFPPSTSECSYEFKTEQKIHSNSKSSFPESKVHFQGVNKIVVLVPINALYIYAWYTYNTLVQKSSNST